eukprot:TRINITY_DN6515_c0_g4_i1.p1 TRINITY_DN6515_c0_g4~~TRINITY_DN6515_c0_g4_i1.p1  ORF type:complete len:203 (+),score=50.64 TRINITY_DN6515_c0_g4_i1:191-799(+)
MPRKTIQPFSNQKSGQRYESIKAVLKTMKKYSGGDMQGLVKALLKKKCFQEVHQMTSDADVKLNSIIDTIKKAYKTKPIPERRVFLSLLAPTLTRKELQNAGFHVDSVTFANARRHAELYGAGVSEKKKDGLMQSGAGYEEINIADGTIDGGYAIDNTYGNIDNPLPMDNGHNYAYAESQTTTTTTTTTTTSTTIEHATSEM